MLRIHCTHHKSGWCWSDAVWRPLCAGAGLTFEFVFGPTTTALVTTGLENWPGPALDEAAARGVDFVQCQMARSLECGTDWRATHLMRDPRDVCVSGYFYHLWCEEPWCVTPDPETGRSYQDELRSRARPDGLMYELTRATEAAFTALNEFRHWDDPRVRTVRYRDAMADPGGTFAALAAHLEFDPALVDRARELGEATHFSRTARRAPGVEVRGTHTRKGTPGDRKNHFTPAMVAHVSTRWGELMRRLNW